MAKELQILFLIHISILGPQPKTFSDDLTAFNAGCEFIVKTRVDSNISSRQQLL